MPLAKRAYLSLLLNPAPALPPPASIKPYDGPDAQAIIHSVTARQHGHAGGRASMSGAGAGVTSGSMAGGIAGGAFNFGQQQQQGYADQQGGIAGYGAQGTRNQGKPQPGMDPGPALTGLGISNYGRHARSASTSSISASEPQHHGFNNTNSRNVSGGGNVSSSNSGSSNNSTGLGRIGGGAHARHGSSGSSAFGRNSAMGAFAFGPAPAQGNGSTSVPKEPTVQSPGDTSTYALPPVSSSASFRATGGHLGGGLATHHEADSPAGTPIKGTASRATLENSAHPSSLAPGFGGNQQQQQQEDATTPGIEILGAVPFPDGGPGGYLATQERRASGGTSSATSGAGGKKDGGGAALDVLGGIRRESLDAKSAEKALREVSKALEGLGVGVAVAAGKS